MNKIYGFGNAMIDIEIQIEEKDLLEINIEKGNMKHIDDNELKSLLNKYSNNIESRLPGGSIANSLYAANQNGASIHFSCSVGEDDYGDYFVSSFENNENLITYKRSKLSTGICLIFVTEDGERTMASNLGANLGLRPEILNLEKLGDSDFLIFDNFSLFSEGGLNTVTAALREKQQSKICFGISDKTLINENVKNLKWLSQNVIDLIYGNNNELSELRNKLAIKSKNILETFGEKGASFNGLAVPAPKVEVINTNGAGDALIGSFLAFKDHFDDKTALFKAVGYASRVCSVNGPRLI